MTATTPPPPAAGVADALGLSMRDRRRPGPGSPSKRRRLRWLVWLGGTVAVLVGLMLLGAGGESLAEAADARAYPPPGQLVDVGGHRLHLHCVGTGSPTVVIEAGLGDWSATWSDRVQPEAARTTRVCAYDRAGLGWSDAARSAVRGSGPASLQPRPARS